MRRGLRLCAVLLIALWATFAGPTRNSHSEEVTRQELETLVERARADAEALDALREVDSVDAVPADIAGALEGADDEELEERLRALGADGETEAVDDPSKVRSEAEDIVTESAYQPREVPTPLRSIGEWVGDRLEGIARFFHDIASHLPGRDATLWAIIALAVILLAVVVVTKAGVRRAPSASPARPQKRGRPLDAPSKLEREAEDAETEGDHVTAIRLRFKAGLLRLDQAGVIRFRPSITSREVGRVLRSPTFEALASTFDEVVYGGRPPSPSDVGAAREGWALITQQARAA